MDYLMGHPTTKNKHDAILVVFDLFSKISILIPCKKTRTMQQTAHLFFEHVWKHYGLPKTIIFDRDSIFINIFWKTLWKCPNTRLSLSTYFHPPTDEQTKVVNH